MIDLAEALVFARSLSAGDWLFGATLIFGVYFVGEWLLGTMGHVVRIVEGLALFSLKFSFVVLALSLLLPTVTIIDTAGIKDYLTGFCGGWFDSLYTMARVIFQNSPLFTTPQEKG